MKTSRFFALCRKASTFGLLIAAALSMGGANAAEQPILLAQGFSKPFIMAPIVNAFRAIDVQRHQSRTQLYREALEVLKKNPAAADVRECQTDAPKPDEVCIRVVKEEKAVPPPQPIAATLPAIKETPAASAPVAVAAETPSASAPVAVAPEPSPPVKRRKVAVLFGNNAYPNPIPPLETPISDVQDIGKLLQDRFGYEVRIVRDARKADVVGALNQVGLETKADDSVLVVYAGHGYLMDDTKMGYWIPIDGSVKSPANWVSNTDISKFLKNIPAKQVILVSDSCFSGSLTREEKISATSRQTERDKILGKRSVLAMSSGGEEPVSDEGKDGHSIFAWSLINALKAAGISTPGMQIFQVVKAEVVKDYAQQPQYGAVLSAGHMEGGEYLFEAPANN